MDKGWPGIRWLPFVEVVIALPAYEVHRRQLENRPLPLPLHPPSCAYSELVSEFAVVVGL